MADEWDEALAATERLLAEDPSRIGDWSLPLLRLWGEQQLELIYRSEVERGNLPAILFALEVCARHQLVMPGWLAERYLEAMRRVHNLGAMSWGDAFGRPYPKGAGRDAIRRERALADRVYRRVADLVAAGSSVGDTLFDRVAAEISDELAREQSSRSTRRQWQIGKTKVSEYYYAGKWRKELIKNPKDPVAYRKVFGEDPPSDG